MALSGPFNEILTVQDLPAMREHYRSRTIVSTNGCFDLLHAGHMRMLAEARALGDLLVVGINDDESVRRLKGPGRPLVRQDDRAAMLAGLKAVDHVVIFPGLLPNDWLALLRPDIHCKSADYSAESLPEAEVVRAGGGRIHILPLRGGYGTSELLGQAIRAARGGHSAPEAVIPGPADPSLAALTAMLSAANSCRQSAYQNLDCLVRAARMVDGARRGRGRLWVYGGSETPPASLLHALRNAVPGGVEFVIPLTRGDRRDLAGGDVLLVVECESGSPDREFAASAAAGGTNVIFLPVEDPSPIPGSRALVLASPGAEPIVGRQLQMALLCGLIAAVGATAER